MHRPPMSPNRQTLMVICLILGGIGATFGAIGGYWLGKCRAAAGWPTAPGKIVTTYIASSRTSRGNSTDALTADYIFEVEGRPFMGHRIHAVTLYGGMDVVREEEKAWLKGQEVTVHYNPADPADACLDTRPQLRIVVFCLVGVVGLLFLLAAAALWRLRPAT